MVVLGTVGCMSSEQEENLPATADEDAIPATPAALANRERQVRALEARRRGYDWETVAQMSGYASARTAAQGVRRLFARVEVDEVDDWRSLHIDKLGSMLLALDEKIEAGNERAIDTALKIMQHRERLVGVTDKSQQPTQVHHTLAVTTEHQYVAGLQAISPPMAVHGEHPFLEPTAEEVEDAEVID